MIYHNPNCGTSRNSLALIRPSDEEDPKWTDDELLDFMIAHPILINRPIVEAPKGVRLCRPSEKVLDILPNPIIGTFTKEDGEVALAKSGRA